MLDEKTVRELYRLLGLDRSTPTGKVGYRWQSTLQAQEIGDFRIIPLTSSMELTSEGWNMKHWAANYDEDCAKGLYQVFSVRNLDGEAVATLSLRYGAGQWRVDQCLGFRYEEVTSTVVEWVDQNGKHNERNDPTDLHFLAQDVARLMNQINGKSVKST